MEREQEQKPFLEHLSYRIFLGFHQRDTIDRRDPIIMFAVNHTLSVADANDILYQFGQDCL